MRTIKIEFRKFGDIHLSDLIGAVGVYVIWDSRAKKKPTYIGEGNILKRLTDHTQRDSRKFASPWDGYIAIIEGSTRNVHKTETEIIERLLLEVADETDRWPSSNYHPGSSKSVLHYCRDEKLRVAISGYDPLIAPRISKKLSRPKEIKIWSNNRAKNEFDFDHDWRFRRRVRKSSGKGKQES